MARTKPKEEITPAESADVQEAVEGTVVNWATKTQVNPNTGEVFDFHGNKIYSIPEEPQS